jgi:hypothetical protein
VRDAVYGAFFDELEKIAISRERLRVVAHERKGRRPIRIDTFLKKDKEGTLFKKSNVEPFAAGPVDPGEARKPKKRGEVPSREDQDVVRREDGREAATTVTGIGQSFGNIGAFNSPAERA